MIDGRWSSLRWSGGARVVGGSFFLEGAENSPFRNLEGLEKFEVLKKTKKKTN